MTAPTDRRAVPGTTDARELLDAALEVCAGDPDAVARLRPLRDRLDGPLRVAVVGRVKAGKSTLLNALVGQRIAPTDAGECTRVVTLYRHGAVPRVVLHRRDGGQRPLPVRRVDGGLQLDLGGTDPDDVACLVVDWPSAALLPATLVDTPGTASLSEATSARTDEYLGAAGPGADAVVFLTRSPQPEDLAVLRGLQEAGGAAGVTTVTVLSRADEIGAGRLDALESAAAVARRLAADPAVRAVSPLVLPVSGLLALAGRTLRHGDFVALRSLAAADPAAVTAMLLTADRFCRPEVAVDVSRDVRVSLVERLGVFGIRLAVMLVRAGIPDAGTLADELVRRSGLAELQRLLTARFGERGGVLRTAAALRAVEDVLGRAPAEGAARLRAEAERIRLATPELAELEVLARSGPDGPFPPGLRADAERLLGGEGTTPAARLGLPATASDGERTAAARAALARWREAADDPLADRAAADAAGVVVRSCEALLAGLLDPAGSAGRVGGAAEPGARGAAEEQERREEDEAALDEERDPVEVGAPGHHVLGDVHREQ
ncbi:MULTISPECIES: dynamin family protein [unclassified Blastococcus]